MRVLDRYIVRTVIGAMALVMAVLLTLLALFLFIREQGGVGTGNYGSPQALRYRAAEPPRPALPVPAGGSPAGRIAGHGHLARGSELTVMRAAGISIARIACSVALAGLLLLPVAVLVGECLAPPLAQLARVDKAMQRNGSISIARMAGPGFATAT